MLKQLFNTNLVFSDVNLESQEDVFSFLESELHPKSYIKKGWKQAIVARENDYPTGLAFETVGIAIPHVSVEYVEKPYIAILKPSKSVLFNHMAYASDPVNAEFIINLGITEPEKQVVLLQELMNIFANNELVSLIREQGVAKGFDYIISGNSF